MQYICNISLIYDTLSRCNKQFINCIAHYSTPAISIYSTVRYTVTIYHLHQYITSARTTNCSMPCTINQLSTQQSGCNLAQFKQTEKYHEILTASIPVSRRPEPTHERNNCPSYEARETDPATSVSQPSAYSYEISEPVNHEARMMNQAAANNDNTYNSALTYMRPACKMLGPLSFACAYEFEVKLLTASKQDVIVDRR